MKTTATKYLRIYPHLTSQLITDAEVTPFFAGDDAAALASSDEVARSGVLEAGERLILRRADGFRALAEWRGGENGSALRLY